MKNLLTLIFFITTCISYSQINFEDRNLALIEKIALNSNYTNIKNYMKKLDFILYSEKTNFYYYINASKTNIIIYFSKNEIKGISMSDLKAEEIELLQKDLKENNFT